jgi:UDP:flavonoid glycosyltransferase YjiC (YdhE family)
MRYAVLVHTFYEYLTRRWRRGPLGLIAGLKGQRPLRLWSSAASVLVAALPELDPASRLEQPTTVHHTGPIWPAGPIAPAPAALDGQQVLVSLSTIHYDGQAAALQSIVDAIADLPVRAIVTTGHAVDPARLRAPRNVEAHRYLPHTGVMPKVSLVIGHGGHGTTMQALAHDLPLVIMPMHPMLDQPMIGRVLQQPGAARVVRKTATPDQIRAAISEMLGTGPHRQAAARLGAHIRASDGAQLAADHIVTLTASAA